jgi:miniconductance mechanosensitive channel
MMEPARIEGLLKDTIASPELRQFVLVAGLLAIAWIVGLLGRLFLHRVVRVATRHTAWRWDDALYEYGTFRWLARMLPAIVVYYGIALLMPVTEDSIGALVRNVAVCWMIVCVIAAMGRALLAFESLYSATPAGKRSIKGVVQLLQLALWIVALVLVVTKLTHQSIGLLLSGIGAMSAVLLLVFKDTILGFVAGIQLSTNDMLRVGDWIEVPGYVADGIVIDIALNTIKVRNFDNTVVMLPSQLLLTNSVKNWRGMVASGARRLRHAIHFDVDTIRYPDDALLAQLHAAIEQPLVTVEGERRTNLGLYRHYLSGYLRAHPAVRRDMPLVIRHVQSTTAVVALEICVFIDEIRWERYEALLSDMLDHAYGVVPFFGLRCWQRERSVSAPSGR